MGFYKETRAWGAKKPTNSKTHEHNFPGFSGISLFPTRGGPKRLHKQVFEPRPVRDNPVIILMFSGFLFPQVLKLEMLGFKGSAKSCDNLLRSTPLPLLLP